MARGKLLRTIKKRIKAEVEARLEGIRKFYKKHPEQWFSDRIAQLFGSTSVNDVMEIIAVFGTTFIVKRIIDTHEEIQAKVQMIKKVTEKAGVSWVSYLPILGSYIYAPALVIPKPPKEVLAKLEISPEGMFPDWLDWLIAFSIAYILVKNFGLILQTVGDVTAGSIKIIKGILGIIA